MEHKSSGDSVESLKKGGERWQDVKGDDSDLESETSSILCESPSIDEPSIDKSVETQESADAMLFGARKSTKQQAWEEEQIAPELSRSLTLSTQWDQEEKKAEAAIYVRQNYIDQAFLNYSKKQYKDAMVLLRKIELNDQPSIAVLVNCAYDFWRSVQAKHEFMPLFKPFDKSTLEFDAIMSRSTQKVGIDKTEDQEEANDTVKKAFTQLFGTGDKSQMVAFDYIRLSHVYIFEGALAGAMQILQLGQARGHLENLLIVIQLWSVLKRLHNKHRDAELCMQYLVTAVQLEEREPVSYPPGSNNTQGQLDTSTDDHDHDDDASLESVDSLVSYAPASTSGMVVVQRSDLPLGYVYLICASHLHRRYMQHDAEDKKGGVNKHKSKDRDLCWNMLAEAYDIITEEQVPGVTQLLKWFNDPMLFHDMAVYLEDSAFPLLAEEALWEAYLRSPLHTVHLEYLVSMMGNHHRGTKNYILEVCEKAYAVNCWNMYARQWLIHYETFEVQKNKFFNNKFSKRFKFETRVIAKIQGCVRGYNLRVYRWPEIYWIAKKKRDEFQGKRDVAEKCFAKVKKVSYLDRFRRWRQYSLDLAELRRYSSIRIQTVFRIYFSKLLYARKLKRSRAANGLFMIISQSHYDMQRTRSLRTWESTFKAFRMERSADCIIRTLISNGYSQVFQAACAQILKVIKVKRKYSNKKFFFEWFQRYVVKKKKSARVTIRFFIRDQIQRKAEEKVRAKNEAQQAAVEILMERSTSYILPLYQKMWGIWRQKLYDLRCAKSKMIVRMAIPRLAARKKARKVVDIRRVKHEIEIAFIQQCLYKQVGNYLKFWRVDRAIRPIQRYLRCAVAIKKLKRLRIIKKKMIEIKRRRHHQWLERSMFLYKKFVYLQKREYHRSARKITIQFQNWLKWKHIKRASRRKAPAYNILLTFHMIMLKRAFKKMSAGVTGLHTLMVLGPMFLSRWRQCVRLGFWRWKRLMIQQKRADGIYNLMLTKIDKRFWHGAHESCYVTKKFTYSKDNLQAREMAKTSFLMSWETLMSPPPNKTQFLYMHTNKIRMYKAFKIMMASRRYKCRLTRNQCGAGIISENLMNKIQLLMFLRQRAAVSVQCGWRQYVAKNQAYSKRKLAIRKHELVYYLNGRPKFSVFSYLLSTSTARLKSRWILQCFFRRMIAIKRFNEARDYQEWIQEQVYTLQNKSRSVRAIMKRHFNMMQNLYVYSCVGLHIGGLNNSIITAQRKLHAEEQARQKLQQKQAKDGRGRGVKSQLSSSASMSSLPRGQSKSLSLSNTNTNSPGQRGKKLGSQTQAFPQTKRRMPRRGGREDEESKDEHYMQVAERMKTQAVQLQTSMHRLQQTGIFIYDPVQHAEMDVADLSTLLQSAQTVFCQNGNSAAVQAIFTYFGGRKLVLCGGQFKNADALGLMHFASQRRTDMSLHFSDVGMTFQDFLPIALTLGEPTQSSDNLLAAMCVKAHVPPPPLGSMNYISELSVDSASIGGIGVAVLLANLRNNCTVSKVSIKMSYSNSLLPSFGTCFRMLGANDFIKEIRIFGCALGEREVQGLHDAVSSGLRALTLLEFSATPEALPVSDQVINLAKNRLYAGRGGLSVSVI